MSIPDSVDSCQQCLYAQCMETFGDRLRRLMAERGVSNGELARRIGKSAAYISLIVNGKRLVDKLPNYDDMRAMARALKVDIDELAGDVGGEGVAESRPSFLAEPLARLIGRLGAEKVRDYEFTDMTASAGTGRAAPKSDRVKPRKPHYVIAVAGDCMVPDIQDGDLIHFDPDLDPQSGDWVVATTNGDNAIVKKLVVRDGISQQLLPLNGEPLTIDENVRILGVVISYERPGPRGRRNAS